MVVHWLYNVLEFAFHAVALLYAVSDGVKLRNDRAEHAKKPECFERKTCNPTIFSNCTAGWLTCFVAPDETVKSQVKHIV